MTVDPKSVDAVFVAALGAADPAARAAILDRECGPNADLRRRVEARLKEHEEATSIVERRPGAAAASVSPAADATVQIAASTGPGPADASRQDEETSDRVPGRRLFLKTCLAGVPAALLSRAFAGDGAAAVRVVVWDEQQPAQKQAYDDFLGNEIAGYLKKQPGLSVSSRRHDEPEHGISAEVLDRCEVLVWWGHVRQREIRPEEGERIVARIRDGKLSLVALHSAHWSTPFIEAMNARAIDDALAGLSPEERKTARVEAIRPEKYAAPGRNDRLTPAVAREKADDGTIVLKVRLPNCCFPAYRADGKPSHVRVLLPKHPLAKGLSERFDIPHTEMYDEPFHVPAPDEVVFEERWDAGEKFRSGAVWRLGRGKVVYFRPGHETYGVYRQPETLQVIENAVRWLGAELRAS